MIINPFSNFNHTNLDILIRIVSNAYYDLHDRNNSVSAVDIFEKYVEITGDEHHCINWWNWTDRSIEKGYSETGYELFLKNKLEPIREIELFNEKNVRWSLLVNHLEFPNIYHLYIKNLPDTLDKKLVIKLLTGQPQDYAKFTNDYLSLTKWTFISQGKIKYPKVKDIGQMTKNKIQINQDIKGWLKSNCAKFTYAKFYEGVLFERKQDAAAYILRWC